MTPIKVKDPAAIAREKERRIDLLRECLGITDETTDTEFLVALIDAVFMQMNQQRGSKGPRSKSSFNNLRLLVKISFRRHSGRAKNLDEAAEYYGMGTFKFKKLRETHKVRWQYIQNEMSKTGKIDKIYREKLKNNLSTATASRDRLVAEREELVHERDKLTATEADQLDLKYEEIFLYDYLIGELDQSCQYFLDESNKFEALLFGIADQIIVPPK